MPTIAHKTNAPKPYSYELQKKTPNGWVYIRRYIRPVWALTHINRYPANVYRLRVLDFKGNVIKTHQLDGSTPLRSVLS